MKRLGLALLAGSVVVLSGLTGCGSAYEVSESVPSSVDMDVAADSSFGQAESVAQAPSEPAEGDATTAEPVDDRPANERPQLIKRAHLSLSVDAVDEGFEQVRSVVMAQQGDVLSMQDAGDRQRFVNFELRVPQERLDATLDDLTEIGTVESRSITTEDVSSQLVDLQARLDNSRQSEAALKEIMSRSGEISDVLEVSRELSRVRQEIEQMAAAQKNLQTQVRYSTITLDLRSAVALSSTKPAFSRQMANSWNAATQSVGDFTTDLLQLGLWLLVYSPYLAILVGGAVFIRKARRTSRSES